MCERAVTVCQLLISMHLGGAEVLAARLARRLESKFRMLFACLDGIGDLGEQLRADGFPVHVLNRSPGVDWRCARRLAKLSLHEGVDVVHAHQYAPFFQAAAARTFGARAPIIMTEHGRHVPDLPKKSHHVANRILLRRRDRVVGVGRDVGRALIENEGFPAGRVEVVYNGIDLWAFDGIGRDRDSIRGELGVGRSDFVVMQVARLNEIKNHATALRTMVHLVGTRPEATLVLVGDGPEAGPIRAMIDDLGLGERVRTLGQRSDAPRLLGAADAALLTSLSEGIPLSLIEAMAAGLPVVATRVGGVPEVVDEGSTGLLAPAGDPAALAGHLDRLAGDPVLRARMGASGRERARRLFSEDRMVDAYAAMYREAAECVRRGRRWPMPAGGGA